MVSEDTHTWFRYAAYPGRFVFLDSIKNQYRIRTGTESRCRTMNENYNAKKVEVDSDGFKAAAKIAVKNGLLDPSEVDDILARFYVRLALCMLRADDKEEMSKCLQLAASISADAAKDALNNLNSVINNNEKEAMTLGDGVSGS